MSKNTVEQMFVLNDSDDADFCTSTTETIIVLCLYIETQSAGYGSGCIVSSPRQCSCRQSAGLVAATEGARPNISVMFFSYCSFFFSFRWTYYSHVGYEKNKGRPELKRIEVFRKFQSRSS